MRSQVLYQAAQVTRGYLLSKRELHASLLGQEGQACFFFSLSLTLLCLLPFVMLGFCRRNHIDNARHDHNTSNKTKHKDDNVDNDDSDDNDYTDNNSDDNKTAGLVNRHQVQTLHIGTDVQKGKKHPNYFAFQSVSSAEQNGS